MLKEWVSRIDFHLQFYFDVLRLCELNKFKVTENSNRRADVKDSDEVIDIGKKFSDVYNNEWAQIFDSLKSEIEDETERIEKLCDCLLVSICFAAAWFVELHFVVNSVNVV